MQTERSAQYGLSDSSFAAVARYARFLELIDPEWVADSLSDDEVGGAGGGDDAGRQPGSFISAQESKKNKARSPQKTSPFVALSLGD